MGYTTKCFVVIFPPCPRAEWMHTVAGKEKKNTARCAVFPLGWWVLGQGAPQEAEQSQRCCFPTGAFLQWAAGIWLKKKKKCPLEHSSTDNGSATSRCRGAGKCTDSSASYSRVLAAKIFALVFRALKMPAGFTPQEVSTNAPHWESSLCLGAFFPFSV